ncbi:MAG: DDE-type integrase/transposase/recombinase [Candidatus Sericytochromatia bacterium]
MADLTYLRTWVGFAYLALVIDVFSRRIVGWAVAGHMRTDLPLEALELAVWNRQEDRLDGLVAHTDAGSQGGCNRSSQHLDREELRWDVCQAGQRRQRGGRRCGRLVVHRWRGGRIGSGSGAAIARGVSTEDAAAEAGVSPAVGTRWFRDGRRARRDRDPARSRLRGAGDRAAGRPQRRRLA